MGSVKDLKILEKATTESPGRGRFIFSDRYSVFDWGEMPDHIPNKGTAIALLGAYFFEKLEKMDVPTHYVGIVENDVAKKLSDIKKPLNTMEVRMVRVIRPEVKGNQYDYSMYRKEKGGYLIPLEVIYRNFLPPGSSVFKRLESGQITPKDLGLSSEPKPNQKLDPPVYDVSTKLEITDRYLTWAEAGLISGLSDKEIDQLKNLTGSVNALITREFSKIGLINEDGKIEVAVDNNRRMMVIDVLGTLDECRFTTDGLPVSKEIARVHYRKSAWFKAVEEAKKKDRQNWKTKCAVSPEPLPPKFKLLISQMYCACTNEVTERKWFKDIPPLKDILKEIRKEI